MRATHRPLDSGPGLPRLRSGQVARGAPQGALLVGLALLLAGPGRAAAYGFQEHFTRWKRGGSIEFVVNMANAR